MRVGYSELGALSFIALTFSTVQPRLMSSHLSVNIGLILGITIGLGLFILSFAISTPSPVNAGFTMLKQTNVIISSSVFLRQTALHLLTAFYEELLWRVCLQYFVVKNAGFWSGIVIIALLFWLSHLANFAGNRIRALEFLAFSLLLGLIYEITLSYPLVVSIHALRNILIIWYRLSLIRKERFVHENITA